MLFNVETHYGVTAKLPPWNAGGQLYIGMPAAMGVMRLCCFSFEILPVQLILVCCKLETFGMGTRTLKFLRCNY